MSDDKELLERANSFFKANHADNIDCMKTGDMYRLLRDLTSRLEQLIEEHSELEETANYINFLYFEAVQSNN